MRNLTERHLTIRNRTNDDSTTIINDLSNSAKVKALFDEGIYKLSEPLINRNSNGGKLLAKKFQKQSGRYQFR